MYQYFNILLNKTYIIFKSKEIYWKLFNFTSFLVLWIFSLDYFWSSNLDANFTKNAFKIWIDGPIVIGSVPMVRPHLEQYRWSDRIWICTDGSVAFGSVSMVRGLVAVGSALVVHLQLDRWCHKCIIYILLKLKYL